MSARLTAGAAGTARRRWLSARAGESGTCRVRGAASFWHIVKSLEAPAGFTSGIRGSGCGLSVTRNPTMGPDDPAWTDRGLPTIASVAAAALRG